MKIRQHPRMQDIAIGDEVLHHGPHVYAQVVEVFPAAVCVKLVIFEARHMRIEVHPQLWRADEIENLSICRYCGGRDALVIEYSAGIPYRACRTCERLLDPALLSGERSRASGEGRTTNDERPAGLSAIN